MKDNIFTVAKLKSNIKDDYLIYESLPSIKDIYEYVDKHRFYKDLEPGFDINEYSVIAKRRINLHLHLNNIDREEYMYLITDSDYKVLYITIGMSHKFCWYKYSTMGELKKEYTKLCQIYNVKSYGDDFDTYVKAYIGNPAIFDNELKNLTKIMIDNKYSEIFLWGGSWTDYPFRDDPLETSVEGSIIKAGYAMAQNNIFSIGVRSLYSKSKIVIELSEGVFIVTLCYNKINTPQINELNKEYGTQFPEDLPIDVLNSLFGLPYLSYTKILRQKGLSKLH